MEYIQSSIPENPEKLIQYIERILNHPDIAVYFDENISARNEQEIIDNNGNSYRPDRLVFFKVGLSIIDYKTGPPLSKHKNQLDRYEELLTEAGYAVKEKVLLYLNEDIYCNKF